MRALIILALLVMTTGVQAGIITDQGTWYGTNGTDGSLLGRDINGNPVAVDDASAVFIYDTQQHITWLADWDVNGLINWDTAVSWAAGLTVGSFGGWRLPTTNTGPSSNCDDAWDAGDPWGMQYSGRNCTGSEMGYLWYTALGNPDTLPNTGPFIDLQLLLNYWSGTEYAPNQSAAWVFSTGKGGTQGYDDKTSFRYAVAVRSGDVFAGSVPEPGSVALLLAGLGAAGFTRRRRTP